MIIEPHTPVLVGVGSVEQTLDEPGAGLDDAGLLVAAARAAVDDAGVPGGSVDWIASTRGLTNPTNPADHLAHELGAAARTVAATAGIPQQTLLNLAFEGIRSGEIGVAIVGGADAKRRADVARRAGVELAAPPAGNAPDVDLTPTGEIVARPEIEVGAVAPVQQYALIENARRPAHGWSIDEHLDDIAGLWSSMNTVAQTNPRAAFGAPMDATAIRETRPGNRLLAWPYNKWHNSQWAVDQSAALVITSAARADELGVPRDRWVFPHVALESSQSLSLSRRRDLHRWPAMGVLGDRVAEQLGRPVAEFDHVELYSCFPAAVRVQQAELGLDGDRVPTLSGGMAFAGGPFNNFVYQSTVPMIERLRVEPGTFGLVTVVSGLLTKPGLTVWSTEPPAEPMLVDDLVDAATDATPVVPLDEAPQGSGRVASYTVVPVDDAPARVVAIVDLDRGERAVAAVEDAVVGAEAIRSDLIGTPVAVDGRRLVV